MLTYADNGIQGGSVVLASVALGSAGRGWGGFGGGRGGGGGGAKTGGGGPKIKIVKIPKKIKF